MDNSSNCWIAERVREACQGSPHSSRTIGGHSSTIMAKRVLWDSLGRELKDNGRHFYPGATTTPLSRSRGNFLWTVSFLQVAHYLHFLQFESILSISSLRLGRTQSLYLFLSSFLHILGKDLYLFEGKFPWINTDIFQGSCYGIFSWVPLVTCGITDIRFEINTNMEGRRTRTCSMGRSVQGRLNVQLFAQCVHLTTSQFWIHTNPLQQYYYDQNLLLFINSHYSYYNHFLIFYCC